MRLKSFMKSGGIAALAAGLAALAIPSAASADPGDHDRGGGRWQGQSENRGGGEARQAPAQAAPPAQAQPAAPAPRNRGGDRNGGDAGRGWGSQRPEAGQRYGRDWNNGGAVNRPEPAFRNRAPDAAPPPQAQAPVYQAPRGRDYADGARNGGYSDRRGTPVQPRQQQGWDGRQWNGQNPGYARDGRANQYERQQRHDGNRSGNWDRDRSGGNWSRDWRRDNRYNWQTWRSHNRDVFRLGRYTPPYRGYDYRRLSIGFYLDTMFFGPNYWLDDPYAYRLPPAYGPYRWVRYYDDALLVNIYDGEVVDVIYDFFW